MKQNHIVLAHAGTHGTVAQLNRSIGPRLREDDVVSVFELPNIAIVCAVNCSQGALQSPAYLLLAIVATGACGVQPAPSERATATVASRRWVRICAVVRSAASELRCASVTSR